MDTMECKHCGKVVPVKEEQTGDEIHCPHCTEYLYTVASPQANKYSEQNPYHRDKPKE